METNKVLIMHILWTPMELLRQAPAMSNVAVYDAVRARHPDIRVLADTPSMATLAFKAFPGQAAGWDSEDVTLSVEQLWWRAHFQLAHGVVGWCWPCPNTALSFHPAQYLALTCWSVFPSMRCYTLLMCILITGKLQVVLFVCLFLF